MPFCRHCGAEVAEGSRFCGGCGKGMDPAPAPAQQVVREDPPPTKKERNRSAAAIGCLSVLAVVIIVAVALNSGSKSPPTPTSGTTSNATSAPATPHVMSTILHRAGSGTATTQKFTVPDDWDLAWSYDCSSFGQSGNFVVDINGDGASDDTPVNQLGPKGSSVEHYHSGGQIYLEVNSECSWDITVKG